MSTTTTTRTPHVLVVELDADGIAPGHDWHHHRTCPECNLYPFRTRIECPGVEAGGCEAWEECLECRTALTALEDDEARDAYIDQIDNDYGTAHGVPHQTFDGMPCVASGSCFVVEAVGWGQPDEVYAIAEEHGPGRHEITWSGRSYEDIEIVYVGPAVALLSAGVQDGAR